MNTLFDESFRIPFHSSSTVEGFEDGAVVKWLENDTLYDSFYAKLYDQLTQGAPRTQAEVGLVLNEWSKRGDDLGSFRVLDAGCGTGIATCAFAKMNVKKVVGLDRSSAMLEHARSVVLPATTLTPEQRNSLEWREKDLIDSTACGGGEFTHACLLYFTVYYFKDKETLFRNLHLWVQPGGKLVVHVVNKHKFDPMLDSASPWVGGLSLQKYSKERVVKSEVTFDKFKYSGEFLLTDPEAEFRETFRFGDGKIRRQKHNFLMEDIQTIVGYAKVAGWEYLGSTDLLKIQNEYNYLLHFRHA